MDIKKVEHALVGVITIQPDCLTEVAGLIAVGDFLDHRAALVYSTILEMWKNGEQIDTMTVITRLRDLVGYIAEAGSIGYVKHAKQYAKDIAESARVLRIKKSVNDLDFKSGSSEITAKLLDIYNSELAVGSKDSSIDSIMNRFSSHVQENKDRGHLGLETGFDFLSGKLIQYVPGHIWTMGGFTSTGKTAMMVEMVKRVYLHNDNPHVVIISTEMTEEQIVARILGNITGIYSQRILVGDLRPGEEELCMKATKYLAGLNLHIYEEIFNLSEIENVARKHNLRKGIDLIYIDYIQNCIVDGEKGYAEQSLMAKRFQNLAKSVRATMVCLSQVSNDVGRGNVDQYELKGAGEWAAVTDVGIMLKKKKDDDRALRAEVAKNRHGARPFQILNYSSNFTRLEEVDGYLEA